MAERFYVNCPVGPGSVVLEGPEAHHLVKVCRVRPGDLVSLFNGDGHEYPARVTATTRHSVALDVLGVASPDRELPYPLVVAAPLPKGDRGQFLVEKLTELGVTTFVPLRTQRSVVHPGETRREKLQRYVVEASKQCGRNVLLQVESVVDWDAFCRNGAWPRMRIVAHPGQAGNVCNDGEGEPKGGAVENWANDSAPWPSPRSSQGVALAVGPEGGFTEEEIDRARQAGWRSVDLGPRILRVETAALVLAAWAGTLPAPNSPASAGP